MTHMIFTAARQMIFSLLLALLILPGATSAQNSVPPPPAGISTAPWPGVMTLDVDATDIVRAIISVRQTIPVAASGELLLRFPEWLPGRHAPRGSIEQIAGLTFTGGGRPLEWRRDPGNPFGVRVAVPEGVRLLEVRFQFLSPTRSSEGRVVVTPAMMNLQWNQLSFYPAGHVARAIRVQPSVTLPAGWTGVAALDGARVTGNRISYSVTDYDTLVDSPMFAGEHFRRWDLGHNVTLNAFADEARFLEAAPEHIDTHRALVDQTVLLFGSRPFDRYEFLLALTDQLGGIGLEHHRSSENTRDTPYFTEWATRGSDRGLLPHELVHSWNGKHRRPAGLATPDFDVAMDGRLLWVYEGQTSYWDLVLAARSGMQTPEMVLGEWARYAATYDNQAGRAWRSLEDTTFDPVISARRPRPFASQSRNEDYYNEGSLIWLEADMLIRQESGGTRSLDDFARAFFGGREGDWGVVPYEFGDLVAALNAIHPYDWRTFFDMRVNRPMQPAPLTGFAAGGYRLVFRPTANVFDAERMRISRNLDLVFSLGVTLDRDGVVTGVQFGGPMFDQGVTNGTKIISVNGMAYSDTRMRDAVTAAAGGAAPITLLVDRAGRYRTITPQWTGGLRYPHLERTGDGPSHLDQLLQPLRPTAAEQEPSP